MGSNRVGAYLRWLHTQGGQVPADVVDGRLITIPELPFPAGTRKHLPVGPAVR